LLIFQIFVVSKGINNMGYASINNLYKDQSILQFKMVYACTKVHGTSCNIEYKDGKLKFFSGGEKHDSFIKIFDQEALLKSFQQHEGLDWVTVYGEGFGGKCQGMSDQYGKDLKFIAFEVRIGEDTWLDVPSAEKFVLSLGLDFVPYVYCDSSLETLNAERDKDCPIAIKYGLGTGFKSEGIVIRPPIEVKKNNGSRIVAKHKRDDFRETKTPRAVSEAELQVLTDATAIADEWVTEMRVTHVLDKIDNPELSKMGIMINAMLEDVKREGEGEITWSKEAEKAVKTKAAIMMKRRLTTIKS